MDSRVTSVCSVLIVSQLRPTPWEFVPSCPTKGTCSPQDPGVLGCPCPSGQPSTNGGGQLHLLGRQCWRCSVYLAGDPGRILALLPTARTMIHPHTDFCFLPPVPCACILGSLLRSPALKPLFHVLLLKEPKLRQWVPGSAYTADPQAVKLYLAFSLPSNSNKNPTVVLKWVVIPHIMQIRILRSSPVLD